MLYQLTNNLTGAEAAMAAPDMVEAVRLLERAAGHVARVYEASEPPVVAWPEGVVGFQVRSEDGVAMGFVAVSDPAESA